jgi:HEAT repeat protein
VNRALLAEFSTSFLETEGAPILGRFLTETEEPDGVELALAWLLRLPPTTDDIRAEQLARLEGRCCALVALVSESLTKQPAYGPIRTKREAHRTSVLADQRATRTGDQRATSTARRDYLRWVLPDVGWLPTRGINQSEVQAISLPLESVYEPTELSPSGVSDLRANREYQRRLTELDLDNPVLRAGSEAEIERVAREFGATAIGVTITSLVDAVAANDRLVVLGDPGSGKTTALRWISLKNARNVLLRDPTGSGSQDCFQQIPVIVRVADLATHIAAGGGAISEFLIDDLVRRSCPNNAVAAVLVEQFASGHCIVLFDGLDEAVDPNLRRSTADLIAGFARSLPKGNRVVVSSRTAGYLAAHLTDPFTPYTVRPLSRPAIEHFLRAYCPLVEAKLGPKSSDALRAGEADRQITKLLSAIDHTPGVRRLAGNPLLLTAMTLIGRNDAQLPARRAKFYDRVVQTLATSWRSEQLKSANPLDEAVLLRVLRQAAWHLRENDPGGTISGDNVKTVLDRLVERSPWCDAIDDDDLRNKFTALLQSIDEHSGLLVERTEGHYAFAHLTFEEFFAADRLKDTHEGIRDRRHQSRWEEPILLALGLMTPEKAEDAIHQQILADPSPCEALLSRDHLLVARVMTDNVEPLPADILQVVDRVVDDYIRRGLLQLDVIRPLAARFSGTGSAALIFDRLVAALTNEADRYARVRAVDALAVLKGDDRVVDALLAALADDVDDLVRSRAIEVLGSRAIGALGSVKGDDRSVDVLLAVLADDANNNLRGMAARALGRVPDESRVADALLAALADPDMMVRSMAAVGLGDGAGDHVVNALLGVLANETDSNLRGMAALGLGGAVDESRVVDALLTALADPDYNVRSMAAMGLAGAVGRSRVVDALLGVLADDSDNHVRSRAALGLGGAVDQWRVVDALLTALADPDSFVRSRAIEALGRASRGSRVVDALLTALADSDSTVRGMAAQWLSRADVCLT